MKFNLKHSKHAVGQNCYHLVWKTKYSVPIFNSTAYRKVCEGAIRQIAINYGFRIYELQVMPDHVHLFIGFPPSIAPQYVVAVLKAKTAGALFRNFQWLKKHFRKGHFWSPGKFYRSVGNVTSDVVQNYIKYSQGTWKTSFKQMPSYYQQRKLSSFVA